MNTRCLIFCLSLMLSKALFALTSMSLLTENMVFKYRGLEEHWEANAIVAKELKSQDSIIIVIKIDSIIRIGDSGTVRYTLTERRKSLIAPSSTYLSKDTTVYRYIGSDGLYFISTDRIIDTYFRNSFYTQSNRETLFVSGIVPNQNVKLVKENLSARNVKWFVQDLGLIYEDSFISTNSHAWNFTLEMFEISDTPISLAIRRMDFNPPALPKIGSYDALGRSQKDPKSFNTFLKLYPNPFQK